AIITSAATPDSHPDCRAPLSQIAALQRPFQPTNFCIHGLPYTAHWAGRREVVTPTNPLGIEIILIPQPEHHGSVQVRLEPVPRSVGAASSAARASSSAHGGLAAQHDLPDFGYAVALDFQDGDQLVPDGLYIELRQWQLVPNDSASTTRFAIRGELYTAQWIGDDLYLIHHPRP
ncbi:hypothetical protein SO180_42365, partial [Bradyrhizobium sp. UFLA05-112]